MNEKFGEPEKESPGIQKLRKLIELYEDKDIVTSFQPDEVAEIKIFEDRAILKLKSGEERIIRKILS